MKQSKLEYTPLKIALCETDLLKPFSNFDIKISSKSGELLLSFFYR